MPGSGATPVGFSASTTGTPIALGLLTAMLVVLLVVRPRITGAQRHLPDWAYCTTEQLLVEGVAAGRAAIAELGRPHRGVLSGRDSSDVRDSPHARVAPSKTGPLSHFGRQRSGFLVLGERRRFLLLLRDQLGPALVDLPLQ